MENSPLTVVSVPGFESATDTFHVTAADVEGIETFIADLASAVDVNSGQEGLFVLSPAVDASSGPIAWMWKQNLDGHRDLGVSAVCNYTPVAGVARRGHVLQCLIMPDHTHHAFAGAQRPVPLLVRVASLVAKPDSSTRFRSAKTPTSHLLLAPVQRLRLLSMAFRPLNERWGDETPVAPRAGL